MGACASTRRRCRSPSATPSRCRRFAGRPRNARRSRPRRPASIRTIRARWRRAASRGFQNALMLDMLGNVTEFGNSNVFMAKDGVVYTPVPNGTFLNGITRQRVISLLRGDGVTVIEKTLRYADFLGADEIFSTGNFAKVAPVIRIDERELKPGPFYAKARKLYWDFAHAVKLAA
ncbi:aminotransferase class IV [Bradyrhizobium sp. DOA1]|uniref:aminotransferase class IV n=1 Tax=Bradyrhizobium sp. DOA1 TaxID=1126616 RepID=UPI001FD99DB2|nr:aminotransferase class IV [Bradyrhizobium sp. DOA1]